MKFVSALDPVASPQVGLLLLSSDETTEQDMRRLIPVEVATHTGRVANAATISSASLAAMAQTLPAAATLLPASIHYDVIAYGCTSATATMGAELVHGLIGQGARTRAITDPLTALLAACEALGVARLAVVTPYVPAVSRTLCDAIERGGVAVGSLGSFERAHDHEVARIDAASLTEAALRVAGDADAVFLSCTNLRTLDLIDDLEARLHRPVFSSNQVLGWHLKALAGISAGPVFGKLM